MKENAGGEEAIKGAHRGVNQSATQRSPLCHRSEVSLVSGGQRARRRRERRRERRGRGSNLHTRWETSPIKKGGGKGREERAKHLAIPKNHRGRGRGRQRPLKNGEGKGEATIKEEEEVQGSANIIGGGLNKLGRAVGKEEEEGKAQELEAVEKGEATKALTPDRHIIVREGGGNKSGGGGEVEQATKVQEDQMELRFKGGELGEKSRPYTGGHRDQAKVDGGEEGPGEALDLAKEREGAKEVKNSVATAIPLSQGGRAPL